MKIFEKIRKRYLFTGTNFEIGDRMFVSGSNITSLPPVNPHTSDITAFLIFLNYTYSGFNTNT